VILKTMNASSPLGAHFQGEQQCSFLVWAPNVEQVEVRVKTPAERVFPLRRDERGYHYGLVEGLEPGGRYYYCLDQSVERPDPASSFQPEGVHGPSEVIDPAFDWEDQGWFGLPLRDYLIYELHVGTFTPEGTFDAIIPLLPELIELGVTALELMPVAQFPGARNWGYDGVYPYAVQDSYGGPSGLKRLVNACHQCGLAVVLDVVYNHLGPEGNYLREFGPYFTDRYRTPWGAALNFDGEHSQEVRRFFLENALRWQTQFHLDALRLDAVHAIKDCSARPFLQELAQLTRQRSEQLNRRFYLIAESDLNDARLTAPEVLGGYGLDGQWSDDFHHSLHVLLTGERDGYYMDFGGTGLLAKVFREGYAYTGQYSAYRRQPHGNSPRLNSAKQFVVYSQNHDQVGNRRDGDRLSRLAHLEGLKLAAGTVLLSGDRAIGRNNGDLTDDHPIGFSYIDALARNIGPGGTTLEEVVDPSEAFATAIAISADNSYNLVTRGGTRTIQSTLYNSSIMTCASCHEVHNKENATQAPVADGSGDPTPNYFLYAKEQYSLICLSCHIK